MRMMPWAAISVVSFFGDRIHLSQKMRLVIQFVCALVFLAGQSATLQTSTEVAPAYLIPLCLMLAIYIVGRANFYNFMDGINGIAGLTGILAFCGLVLYAHYVQAKATSFMPELSLYIACACLGFLPLNFPKAQVFMGDTGSLALGGIIAVFAIMIRKEIMIPIFCGVFVAENLSVVMQVTWFKYTRHKYGEGRRIFKMSPLHHHFQKVGYHESKIVMRFLIIGIMLAVLTIVTLKLR